MFYDTYPKHIKFVLSCRGMLHISDLRLGLAYAGRRCMQWWLHRFSLLVHSAFLFEVSF
ncbi:Protein of unknown function [Pyronema omphalodes CBS 100304]|uniref:Uncharacterized protein n=1 Tax=Pyronema omphalodes (strain CBS 100304) TaxID=1076935 RepID=U4LQ01_PYROM|nr:Protein of unknown function [Pyronema omphalodes CBS 100304]